jgi:hypothetical protein
MKSFLASLLFAVLCLSSVLAFSPIAPRTSIVSTGATSTSLNVFGKKKSSAAKERQAEVEAQFWQGEWVCKDCGYIYNRVRQSVPVYELSILMAIKK